MEHFINRLVSFQGLPDDVILPVTDLCDSGFYYIVKEDEVVCFSCGVKVKVKDWEKGLDPLERHLEVSPGCCYINHLKTNHCSSSEILYNISPNFSDSQTFLNFNVAPNGTDDSKSPLIHANIGVNGSDCIRQENHEHVHNGSAAPRHSNPDGSSGVVVRHPNPDGSSGVVRYPNPDGSSGVVVGHANPDGSSRVVVRHPNLDGSSRVCVKEKLPPDYYKDVTNRTRSYVNNWSVSSPVTVNDLVSAGLFYKGPGDKVKCAWCNGGLYNFVPGDIPINEHARHYPDCPYVKSKTSTIRPNNGTNQQVSHELHQPNLQSRHNKNQVMPKQYPWLHDQSTKRLIEMGYTVDKIHTARERVTSLRKKMTVENILQVLFQFESSGEEDMDLLGSEETTGTEVLAERHPQHHQSHLRHDESHGGLLDLCENLSKQHQLLHHQEEQQQVTNDNSYNMQRWKQLQQESLQLKNSTLCKLCHQQEVNMVLLPCAHLIVCEGCSRGIKNCPLCKSGVVNIVKTYMS